MFIEEGSEFSKKGERVIKSSVQIEYFIDRYKHNTIKFTEKMHRYIRNIDMEKNLHADHKWAQLTLAPHTCREPTPRSRNKRSAHQPSLRKNDRVVLVTNVTHGQNSAKHIHTLFIG